MKRILLSCCMLPLAYGSVSAQQIRSTEPDATDALWALQAAGYELFNFDLSDLKDKTYDIQIYLKEVDSSGTKEKTRFGMGETRGFLKNVSEENRSNFTPIDPETGLYRLVSKMGLYVVPKNDSVFLANFRLDESRAGNMLLKLRPLQKDPHNYRYTSRVFKLNEFKPGVDIPLMLYGSFWYDEQFKVNRFCGENEIDPDMSTDILKYIPHYYIIGIRLTETN